MAFTSEAQKLKRPIKIGLAFSVFTIFLFEFGVYDFFVPNRLLFYVFLFACNLSMYLGFTQGLRKTGQYKKNRIVSINKVVKILFWAALLLAIPDFMLYTRVTSFSLGEILLKMAMSTTDAATLYSEHNNIANAVGIWRYINWLVILFSPLHWAYIPLSFYYWGKLTVFKKLGTCLIWFLYCAKYLVTGTNVGIFVIVVFAAVSYIIKKNNNAGSTKKKKKSAIGLVIIALLTVIILAAFFNMTMSSRIGDSIGETYLNRNSIFWILTPEPFRNLLCYFTRYLANAYNAVAMSFSLPWDCTFGLGHSFYLLDQFDPGQTWLWPRTYNLKMDQAFGWDYYAQWHTPYVWFANDVSHFGVPIVLFILFRFFGKAWRRFNEEKDIISYSVFMMFVLFMTFVSANNQVFQTNSTLIAFWLYAILFNQTKKIKWVYSSNEI